MQTTPEEKINACIRWAKKEKAKCETKSENEDISSIARHYFNGYIKGATMVAKMLDSEVESV